jgi:hypothetical protein
MGAILHTYLREKLLGGISNENLNLPEIDLYDMDETCSSVWLLLTFNY